eukprot:TRINITY_DN2341_c0_g1_i6.p1 TRINITY_DN2341_c0_g1~~TRINITY_DN2341_c0_g1_i6.p1  ORF type:complete len:368 (+),score=74.08 TRINITY_DN2341_c0_g1_i6:83-1186(+)
MQYIPTGNSIRGTIDHSQVSKTRKHRNHKFDPSLLKVSPKFGNPEHSAKLSHGSSYSTKHFSRAFKDKHTSDTTKHSKENSKSFYSKFQPYSTKSHHYENKTNSVHAVANNEAINKSCDFKKHDNRRSKKVGKILYETSSSYNVCDNSYSHNRFNLKPPSPARVLESNELTEEEFNGRIKELLKKIKNKSTHSKRVSSLFEELILRDKAHGHALRRVKEFYEWEIGQLNERVGRHDIRCKEYKKALEKCRRAKDEKERKYENAKTEIKKQKAYIESQAKLIANLKERLEINDYSNSPNAKYLRTKDNVQNECDEGYYTEEQNESLKKKYLSNNIPKNNDILYENDFKSSELDNKRLKHYKQKHTDHL